MPITIWANQTFKFEKNIVSKSKISSSYKNFTKTWDIQLLDQVIYPISVRNNRGMLMELVTKHCVNFNEGGGPDYHITEKDILSSIVLQKSPGSISPHNAV